MKKILALIVLGCMSFVCPTYADSGIKKLVPKAEDLFLKGKFSVSRNRFHLWEENHFGEDMDLSEKRPAVNLSGSIFDLKYGRPNTKLMANFYHAGRFYIARVPDQAVKRFYFHLSYFPPKILGRFVAAHSLLRFELEPDAPLELVTEMPNEETLSKLETLNTNDALAALPEPLAGPTTRLLNVVISAEATWTQQDPKPAYNLLRGGLGAYLQIVRFESMEVRLEDLLGQPHPVVQYEFPLQVGDGDLLLASALKLSESDGLNKIYNTLAFNCTTRAFDIVESVLGRDPRIGFIRSSTERVIPTIAPDKIRAEGGLKGVPLETQLDDPSLQVELNLAKERVKSCDPLLTNH